LTLQAAEPRLVLASQSAARAKLLRAAGLTFDTQPAFIDEDAVKQSAWQAGADAATCAMMLAAMKASRVSRARPDALVIGADQMLVCDGQWFDKPKGLAEARGQLNALRGRTHVLVTAVTCWRGGQDVWRVVAMPRLSVRSFSSLWLDAYIAAAGEEISSSVGAYRIEEIGLHLFDSVDGEPGAVMGLPMISLLQFLRQHGVILA